MEQNFESDLPSVAQLASLAALVSHGRNEVEAANYAVSLWKACKAVRDADETKCEQQLFEKSESKRSKTPARKSFPAPLAEFLRVFVGGRDASHRLELFKEYLLDQSNFRAGLAAAMSAGFGTNTPMNVAEPFGPKSDQSKIAEEIKRYKKLGICEPQWFGMGDHLTIWLEGRNKEARSAQAREAAKARHGR